MKLGKWKVTDNGYVASNTPCAGCHDATDEWHLIAESVPPEFCDLIALVPEMVECLKFVEQTTQSQQCWYQARHLNFKIRQAMEDKP